MQGGQGHYIYIYTLLHVELLFLLVEQLFGSRADRMRIAYTAGAMLPGYSGKREWKGRFSCNVMAGSRETNYWQQLCIGSSRTNTCALLPIAYDYITMVLPIASCLKIYGYGYSSVLIW